jgi:hypothetical protein
MKMRRPVALTCIALNLAQLAAPLLAHVARADDNPFSHVPGPSTGTHPAPAPTHAAQHPSVPIRPTPLAPPHTDDPLVCVSPDSPEAQLTPFQRLTQDYIAAYYADDPMRTHYLAEIAQQVFLNPGSPDYVSQMQYLDSQGPTYPEAMYDAGRALQNRWEASYGMEISQRLAAGIDPGVAGNETIAQRRANRVHEGETGGALIGAIAAMAALGVIALRNPTAVPKYFAVFRAIAPAAGFTAGFLAGHGAATALNASGFFERNIPLAPAHVMRLGVEKDDFTQNDETLVRTLVPLVLSIGAGEAAYVAIEGETMATTLLATVRAFRVAGMAAAGAEVEFPPGLVATIVVTIVVDKLATAGINAWEYHSLKSDVIKARDIVYFGVENDDNLTLFRGADTLVAKTLAMAAYINRPVLEANSDFIAGMAKASKDHPQDSPEFQADLKKLTAELSEKIRETLEDSDQAGDADYEAYLALDSLENEDASALDALPDLARHRARAYAEAFETYRQGFDAYIDRLQEQLQVDLGEAARNAEYNRYFHRYVVGMRAAKDKQLTAAFRAGEIPRHAGHLLLQASAMLRSTGREYVQGQADFLMAEVARDQLLIRAASMPAGGNAPDPAQQAGRGDF